MFQNVEISLHERGLAKYDGFDDGRFPTNGRGCFFRVTFCRLRPGLTKWCSVFFCCYFLLRSSFLGREFSSTYVKVWCKRFVTGICHEWTTSAQTKVISDRVWGRISLADPHPVARSRRYFFVLAVGASLDNGTAGVFLPRLASLQWTALNGVLLILESTVDESRKDKTREKTARKHNRVIYRTSFGLSATLWRLATRV